ncbi:MULTISPECIES: hypothetical protein [Actinosynnema]|uniref:hypothetical protein n=1 Tax=Actinosynnema TaxID=40566 RepID=UPI0020A5ADC2|nr:hypothetical protein [Actinosynnema pretiosum]MCP2094592.1 hypothetical protein [Actinosynnema pretiosum]
MRHSSDEGELRAHLSKLDDVGARINEAVSAVEQTSNPMAFGALGAPLMAICAAAQAMAGSAIDEAAESAVEHHRAFGAMALDIRHNEQARVSAFDGMHNG